MQLNPTCRACGQPLVAEAGAAVTCTRCRARRRVLATILQVAALVLFLAAMVGAAEVLGVLGCQCSSSETRPDLPDRLQPGQLKEAEPIPPPAPPGSPQTSNR